MMDKEREQDIALEMDRLRKVEGRLLQALRRIAKAREGARYAAPELQGFFNGRVDSALAGVKDLLKGK